MEYSFVTKNQDGFDIEVSLLGFFSLEELAKEYVMYSIVDNNPENNSGSVLIGEAIRKDNTIKIIDIKKDEVDVVLAAYNEISTQVGA